MTLPRFLALGTLLLATPSCGGQVGEENGAACTIVRSTVLAPDELPPLGMSANDVLAHLGATRTVTVAWADGAQTTATITFGAMTGAPQHHERQWRSSGDGGGGVEPAIAIDCEDQLEVPLAIGFSTADGAFDENWSASIVASVSDFATFSRNIDEVRGSFVVSPYVPAGNWNSVRAWLSIGFGTDTSGEIEGQAAGENGDVAFAESFSVAKLGSSK